MYRARENERPGALFRDPFARRLAGAYKEEVLGSQRRTCALERIRLARVPEGFETTVQGDVAWSH